MFQFPPNPSPNQTFTPVAGVTYRWSGTAWHLIAGPGAFITQADADVRYVNIDEAQNVTNRIINGKMAIDQRTAFAGINLAGTAALYGPDRWQGLVNGGGVLNIASIADFLYVGQRRARLIVFTADATLAAGDYYVVRQVIEGVNIADLNFGSAQASPFVFACEMESSIPATLPISFNSPTRSYVTTVTLAANTRTSVVITVPGDTAGTWATDNSSGMRVSFGLGLGSSSVAPTANAWVAGEFTSVAGVTNFMGTLNAALQLNNVRLYKGSVDFGPDRRLYAEELALCQRYYAKSYALGVVPGTVGLGGASGSMIGSQNSGYCFVTFPQRMRAPPTITLYSGNTGVVGNWTAGGHGEIAAGVGIGGSDGSVMIQTSVASTVQGFSFLGHWTASAEL